MSHKTNDIADAAKRMFMRYGYSKTTMADIAAEAGVARQTVYNAFPGKDEILRVVVRRVGDETLATVKAAWEQLDTVEEKLDAFLTYGPLAWYEAVQDAPDAADLIEGMHSAAAEELECHAATWHRELLDMIETTGDGTKRGEHPLPDIVEFFYASSINAKNGAEDAAHLKQRLDILKTATLALL